MINTGTILEFAKENNSFYIYDKQIIDESIITLKSNFNEINFLYSIKCNHNRDVVKTVLNKGFGVDAASAKEVIMGVENGISRDMIQYSAPGKSYKDIYNSIESSTIIADSIYEIELIQEIAKEKGIIANIGVRINPSFSFDGANGIASKFGIDEELFIAKTNKLASLPNIKITGIHIHLRSQELDISALIKYYENVISLFSRIQRISKEPLLFLNMGSGIGVKYSQNDIALDIKTLGTECSSLVSELKKKNPQLKVFIEVGRFITAKSGIYVTKIMDIKTSCGKKFIILHNTLNGFLRASIALLIKKYTDSKDIKGSEPLFSSYNAYSFYPIIVDNKNCQEKREYKNDYIKIAKEKVTLVGNLCTAADIVAEDIELPKLKRGDLIVVNNAGSYAAVLSPMQFSSQVAPAEHFISTKF